MARLNVVGASDRTPLMQKGPGGLALMVLAVGLLWLAGTVSLAQAGLLLTGAGLGVVLYHAAFGFTSAWRRLIVERRGRGLRAQMVLLTVAVVLFFPPLASGTLFGHAAEGFVAPIGVSVAVGAFMFGLGMQLGGGCASGTLFTADGGSARMMVTLLFFILGSVLATVHFDWWMALPALAPVSLPKTLGPTNGIFLSLFLFGVIALGTVWLEKRRHGGLETVSSPKTQGWARLLRGPWPLLAGAVALAVLNFITLSLAGRPWGITSAFALWGAKGAGLAGIDPSSWVYWQAPDRAAALDAPVWQDVTTVMNVGIIAGAMLAAALAGRFAPNVRIPARSLIAAVLGGLLLGYGARIAFGCNIGAYFSGIASGSLHGWLWLVFAFAGNMLGVRLRPFFFRTPYTPSVRGC